MKFSIVFLYFCQIVCFINLQAFGIGKNKVKQVIKDIYPKARYRIFRNLNQELKENNKKDFRGRMLMYLSAFTDNFYITSSDQNLNLLSMLYDEIIITMLTDFFKKIITRN